MHLIFLHNQEDLKFCYVLAYLFMLTIVLSILAAPNEHCKLLTISISSMCTENEWLWFSHQENCEVFQYQDTKSDQFISIFLVRNVYMHS